MNGEDGELPRALGAAWPYVWPLLGGLGGAIISLGLASNVLLTPQRKAFNVLCGTLMAIFLGPLVVRLIPTWFGGTALRADSELVGGIYCLVGLSGTSVMDRIVRWIGKWVDGWPTPKGREAE